MYDTILNIDLNEQNNPIDTIIAFYAPCGGVWLEQLYHKRHIVRLLDPSARGLRHGATARGAINETAES